MSKFVSIVANARVTNSPGDSQSPGGKGVGAQGDEAADSKKPTYAPKIGPARRRVKSSEVVGISSVEPRAPLNPYESMIGYGALSLAAWQELAATAERMIEAAAPWHQLNKAVQEQTVTFWLNFFKPVMDAHTRLEVNTWLEKDARKHTQYDGTSAAGRYYTYMKNEMQSMLDFFPGPIRIFVTEMLKNDPDLQERMRDELMAEQFEMIDSIIRKRYPHDHGKLFDDKYNGKFLTETRPKDKEDGKIIDVDASEIVNLFKKPASDAATLGKDYPHVIITFSHAQGETEKDVKEITHGIESLASHSQDKKLPLGYLRDEVEVNRGHTVVVYACDVDKTPWLNGAALLRRVNELKRIAKTGEPDREFKHVSRGAKRVAKLMLACMVENPEQILEQLVDVKDGRTVAQMIADSPTPLRLRSDAVHIANHFQLVGYSKGGNTASDAMRYLIYELTSKRANGEPAFATHAGQGLEKKHIKSVVRGIATMALASVEVGLSEFDKEHGLRRVAVNNEFDLISAHKNYEGCANDERVIVKGNHKQLGHAPAEFLGDREPEEKRLSHEFNYRVGFAIEDKDVKRRLQEFNAPHFGKAAISAVHFGGQAANDEVYFETAPGTTDAQLLIKRADPKKPSAEKLSAVDKIKIAFQKQGLTSVSIQPNPENPGFFTLKAPGTNFTSLGALQKLTDGFAALRENTSNEIVIAQTIIDRDIGEPLKKAEEAGIRRVV